MKLIRNVKLFLHKDNRMVYFARKGAYRNIPDEKYLKIRYKATFGKDLNLDNPKTFNEKLQWLKINDRKEIYTTMVDKYAAKEFIKEKIGEEYVIPTYGLWDKFEDIDFDELPSKFVIKCTHDSGGLVICKDKSTLDIKKCQKQIQRSLKNNFFWVGREWPYKNVPPRIICEELLQDDSSDEPINNWKFYCANGKLFAYYVTSGGGHSSNLHMTYFGLDDKILPIKNVNYPVDTIDNISIPKRIDEMKKIAEKLSENTKFLRVDFYYVNDKIYVGELTFYPGCGFEGIEPYEIENKWGELIDISK